MSRKSANELTPPAEQIARFRRDFEAVAGRAPDAGHKFGVAVSGGADSLALLLLAAATFPGLVIAATVDHGLRPEAAGEARRVGQICAELGVPHAILTGAIPAGNLQEGARTLRYALLAEWAGDAWVATAHQRDDVAETFLMRARRGAGVGGLAAMRAARPLGSATLIRPLLGWSRAELEAIVTAAGVVPVQDPSNRDPRFDRARIRRLLAESPELPADRLAFAAANLRHAEDALVWAAEREWQARSRITAEVVHLDPAGLPYELLRRLVERSVKQRCFFASEPPPLRGESLDHLLATLLSGGTGTIAGVKASAKHAEWRFSQAPARRSH
ncbi:tRNA lysidine(34) synthetase TilS [Sphingomonas sp. LM7]|uniref:tRNA lysidine(34) synthetase TilS n=1 Tax=Sphingomonas sp. LM7 TaxID=1938607 RepID=UPI000983FDFC|nr:tRNA lysidine(34) synthetase TilS [Sphingomonas sp. LM7]AQR75018.1 tRNA lysidine(34) synthetase TilS [Sphingomonas sp. LM7]